MRKKLYNQRGSFIVAFLLLNSALLGVSMPNDMDVQIEHKIVRELIFDAKTEAWKADMRHCESTDNSNAINEVDLDGTASWGLYQFKPSTWKHYVQKYDLWNWRDWDDADWHNTMMSRDHQLVVFSYMIPDPDVRRNREFPWCVKRYGYPPASL